MMKHATQIRLENPIPTTNLKHIENEDMHNYINEIVNSLKQLIQLSTFTFIHKGVNILYKRLHFL